MAYEVARVHGLILSNIQDGEKDSVETWPVSKSIYQMPPRSSPDTPFLYDFPSELNQWSESSHSSSLESSTETETESDDEDDFIAGLAEQIAHSMLEDDEPSSVPGGVDSKAPNASSDVSLGPGRVIVASSQKVALSPQSSWSPNSLSASWSDSVSSSKQSSQMSSPPSTPSTSESDAWDLLNAAAGEVVRLKMNEERRSSTSVPKELKNVTGDATDIVKQCSRVPKQSTAWRSLPHLVELSSQPSNIVGSRLSVLVQGPKDRLPVGGGPYHLQKSCSRPRDDERKVNNNVLAQHRLPRNDGVGWNQRQSRPANPPKAGINQKFGRQNYNYGGHPRMSGKSMDCTGVAQRTGGQSVNGGSGMRAVFLGSAGSGRESGGTGVFLPRCIGGGSEHRRKPACSTVLLPSRIVQVLNLNVEDMRTHPAPLPAVSAHGRNEFSGALRTPPPHMYMVELSAGTMTCEADNLSFPKKFQGSRIVRSEPVEFSLPTEWTY